uniref:Uncharacterized protein n=1 Tax=Physcomitrium patens TaxID=3218 RepID=A0A2K1JHG5_PHYPA|nr:hypothetical protein PHYPA_018403 [Physcomitrium patens]
MFNLYRAYSVLLAHPVITPFEAEHPHVHADRCSIFTEQVDGHKCPHNSLDSSSPYLEACSHSNTCVTTLSRVFTDENDIPRLLPPESLHQRHARSESRRRTSTLSHDSVMHVNFCRLFTASLNCDNVNLPPPNVLLCRPYSLHLISARIGKNTSIPSNLNHCKSKRADSNKVIKLHYPQTSRIHIGKTTGICVTFAG